ncbi:oligosaccharide flippase family protein [bacterium]|nr:oligosaccharide flippase family protein [bacterium]
MLQDFKSILKHGSIYSLGNILSKLVGFLMIPIYTRYLTPADYGVLELLTLVSVIFSMVLALRLTSGLTRYYREYEEQEDRNRLVSTALVFTVVLAALAYALLSRSGESISLLVFKTAKYHDEVILIIISLAFEMCASVAYTYLRILEKSVHFILISFLQLVIGLSLNVYFIVVLQWGLNGILYSMVVSNGVAFLLLSAYTFAQVRFHFDAGKLRGMLVFGLPLIPAGFLIFILNMGDRFLLGRLTTLSEVGIYALGYKFGMMLGTFIGGPFSFVWAPKRVEIYKDRTNRDEIFTRVFLYLFLVLALVGLAISILIKDVLTFIAAPEFLPAFRVVPLVTLGYVFYTLYYLVDFGFYINNKTYWYIIINAVAAALNVGLNLWLIPRHGAMGAAMATAISFLVCPILAYLISQRYYYLKYDFVRIGKLIAVILVLYWIGSSVATNNPVLNLTIKSVILILAPVLLYFANFFEPRELAIIKNLLLKRFGISS